MKKMDQSEIARLFDYFAHAWPNSNVKPEQMGVWADQLVNIDFEDAQTAAKELVGSSKWFPSVAEFKAACGAVKARRVNAYRGLPEPSSPADERKEAMQRWLEVAREALRRVEAGEVSEPVERPSAGRAPTCPRCSERSHVERLPKHVGDHSWLCGACWLTFAGSQLEWEAMVSDRRKASK